ncbi:MAG TPA: hypothetical protein VFU35_06515, partial [Jatrophihabitans sp.]|nr:hypothetical protein [Jatrophihabitans sp.]
RQRTAGTAARSSLAAVLAAVAVVTSACSDSPAPAASTPAASAPAGDDQYGPLPSFLPTSSLRPDSVLTGTARSPAVTSEGDGVRVVTGAGSVLATVIGPRVPREGIPHPPETTMCTWTVTFAHANGHIRIDLRDFAVIDEQGHLTRPYLAAGAPHPPTSITSARVVRFALTARMRVGEGVLQWAPNGRLVASWDFVAETD